jgi:hypothetical protein
VKTREETVANKIADLLADIRLDAERIGFYLGHMPDPDIYDRLELLLDSTKLTREQRQERIKKMILGLDLD